MVKDKNGKIVLSPSALNLFLECAKCFWLEKNRGIHRPAGAFPSLPGGMDAVLKKYFDKVTKTQIFVDLWNLKEWYAKDYLNALERRLDAILA